MKPWQVCLLCAILVVSLFAGESVTFKEVPPKAFYGVSKSVGNVELYLAFVDVGSGFKTDIREIWTVDRGSAWRYGERLSAQADVDKFGGWVIPIEGRTK